MPELFPLFLFLHVLGAVIALGPAFAFPVIGAMAAREPAYANFATRVSHRISDRLVEPFILSTAVTGVGMIWSRSIPVFDPAYRWLLLSLFVYVAALSFSWFVQRPTVVRVIELSAGPGAPGPELGPTVGRMGRNGMVLTFLGLALVFLMVVKPSLGF